jgi:integrase
MKRANGTGNIVKLPGNRRKPWAVRVSYWEMEDGARKRKRKVIGTFRTRREAQSKINELVLAKDDFIVQKARKPLVFKDYLDEALDRIEKTFKNNTYLTYSKACKRLEKFYAMPIQSITGEMLQEWVDEMAEESLSVSAVGCSFTMVRKAVKVAIRRGALQHDPTVGVEMGLRRFKKPKEKTAYSHAEIMSLWHDPSEIAKTALMLIYTGMRSNEFLAITPEDYKDGVITVRDSKTSAGQRVIPVADCIRPIVEERLKSGRLYHAGYFNLREQLRPFGHGVHETRHTFATLLDETYLPNGHKVDLTVAKVLMGHKVSDITKGTYTHESFARLVEAVNSIPTSWVGIQVGNKQ